MGSLSDSTRDLGLQYPLAFRDESVVDDYHGVSIADPYRWLEDPDAKQVKEFVEKQASLTESVLKTCETREDLRRTIERLFDNPRFSTPFKKGNKYFYFHNSGLQAHDVLYVQDSLEEEAEVLLDPNGLSEDGTVALNMMSISEDAKYIAYGLSSRGSDWVTVKVMRVDDKAAESDCLSWVKFSSINWTHDGKGFFYCRYPAPKEGNDLDAGTETNIYLNHEVRYHFLGTDQSEDILCWRDPDHPKWTFGAQVTDDGKYLLLYINEGCDPVEKLYYCDLSALENGLEGFRERSNMLPFIKLVDNFDACYGYVANDESEFTFLTNKDAPKYKLVRVNIKEPEEWVDVVPQSKRDVLKSAEAVNGNQVLVSYLSDVKCELESGVPEMKIFREIVVPGFDRTAFEVRQVFASSKDGTKIPMFVVSKKDIQLDNSHPSLLFGYGGFNVTITPSFSVARLVLMRHLGIVFCIANIRGGGEYGEEWHKAGSLSKKQNCFDDFIASAEYLVSSGYTRPDKLCIEGGSNGGLLVAACINQIFTTSQCEKAMGRDCQSDPPIPLYNVVDG
ncbi:hypothetical protein QJS10_CPB15g00324 [Acorus calamus]|uniref:Prolyl endopeptidase n=1 Tax=Acorus calamus TaxID=4465 RepID=A0AAV9D8N3_ACOCL|nr:hypothetical protein QJS10_CPB15g00324 [Acorus calamus]